MALDILISGANRGIGLEYARQLSARGDRVVATCRRPEEADELGGLDVEVRRLDVDDPGSIAELVERIGDRPLDILINNAGVGVSRQDLGDLDYDQIERFFRVNAMGPLRLTEALLPRLREGERKLVVNMTSRMGSIDDNTSGGAYAYRGSKAALNMFNRSLAVDLEPEGIVCVVLHPGWVRTRMGGSSAPTSVEESVSGLIEVIDGLDAKDSGGFYDYTGAEIPW